MDLSSILSFLGLDFTGWNLGTFAGVAAAVWGLLEALKSRFKWVDGIEEYLAVVLPMVVVAVMKWQHWGYGNTSWLQTELGALMAGLGAQLAHDKLPAAASTLKDHTVMAFQKVWSAFTGK